MSAIDYETTQFFNHMASLSWELDDNKDWIKEYEKNRHSYPDWITRGKKHIKIYDIEDDHLDNLIAFLKNKDKNDEAISWWLSLFNCEKKYRKLKHMKRELTYMENISDKVF